MTKPIVTLYFDIVSPFSYEAYYILRHDPVFSQCDRRYVPVLLAGIFKASGNIPPSKVPNKLTYVAKQRRYFAGHYRIPIADSVPAGFPHSTLSVMRVLLALTILYPPYSSDASAQDNEAKFLSAIDAFYNAYHVQQLSAITSESHVLADVLAAAVGPEVAGKVLELSSTEEVKKELEANGQVAMAEGAFGLPWMVAERDVSAGEGREKTGFWGVETLERMVRWLRFEGKLECDDGARERL